MVTVRVMTSLRLVVFGVLIDVAVVSRGVVCMGKGWMAMNEGKGRRVFVCQRHRKQKDGFGPG